MPIQDEVAPATADKVLAVKVSPTSKSTPSTEMSASKPNEPEGAASIMLQSVSPINEAPQPSTSFSASYRSAPGGPIFFLCLVMSVSYAYLLEKLRNSFQVSVHVTESGSNLFLCLALDHVLYVGKSTFSIFS